MDDNVIRDFFFKLGFDGEDVLKGLKSVQGEFGTLQKALNKMATIKNKISLVEQRQTNKEIALEKQKLAIRKTLATLKDEGFSTGRLNAHQALRSNDPVKVAKALSKAEESLHNHRIMQKNVAKELNNEIAKGDAIEAKKLAKIKEQEEVQKRIALEAKKQNDYQMQLRKKYVGLSKNRDNFSSDVGNKLTQLKGQEGAFAGKEGSVYYKKVTADLLKLRLAAKNASADGLADLRRQFKGLNTQSSEFVKRNRAVANSLFTSKFAANSMKDSLRNLSRSYLSVFAVGAGAVGSVHIGQDLIALRATLLGVSGDLEKSAEDFEFVKKTSKELGIGLSEATSAYGKIGAASKSAGLSVEQGREVFLAVSELSTAFSLDNTDFEGVSRAMSQILSKGKLSTEELLQLGERIPIVFSSAAKALGVTTKELYKEIEKGDIQSVDFAPGVVKEWRSYVRETGMLAAQLKTSRTSAQKFGTTFKENVLKSFDAGMETGLAGFFRNLTGMMEYMSPMFRVIGKALGVVLETLSVIALAVYQIIRPVGILFEAIVAGSDDGQESLGGLMRLFHLLVAVILVPFWALEKFNNALAESGGLGKTAFGILLLWLGKVIPKITFFKNFITKITSGVGLLSKSFSLFGIVAKGVLTAISRHPVIASIFALVSSLDYLMAKSSQASTQQGKEVIASNYNQLYGVSKDNALVEMLSTIGAMKHEIGKDFWGMFGVSLKDMAPLSSIGGGATYNINVTTPDTEAAIRTLEPYLEGKLTTWGTDVAKSSMAQGEN